MDNATLEAVDEKARQVKANIELGLSIGHKLHSTREQLLTLADAVILLTSEVMALRITTNQEKK